MILKLPFKTFLSLVFILTGFLSSAQIFQGSTTVNSSANMTVTVTVNTKQNTVDLTLTGPSSQWFGYGFGGSTMFNRYAIVTLGSGSIQERKLGNHAQGTLLASSFSSSNTSTAGATRTVTITRPISGPNSNYYTFPTTATTIPIIWARGSSATLSQHAAGNRGPSMISMVDMCNIPTTVLTPTNACTGDSALIFGVYQTAAGIYSETFTTPLGCDSVVEQELILQPSGTFTQPSVTICQGDSTLVLGQYRHTAGVYTLSLTSSNGCDSIASQEVMVNTVDTAVMNSGDTLVANASGAQYQWYDCSTGLALSNATSKNLVAPSGTYRVEVTMNGCTASSGCHFTDGISSLDERNIAGLELFPNPVTDQLNMKFEPEWLNGSLRILNSSGSVVYRKKVNQLSMEVDLSRLPGGIYFLSIEKDAGFNGMKFIKY